MKKIVVTFIFVMSIGYANAQEFVEVLKKGVCNCIAENQPDINFSSVMNICFNTEILQSFIEDANKKGEINISVDSIQKLDYLNGNRMGMQMMSDLITECDGMYKIFDDMREVMRTEKRAEKPKQYLDSLNGVDLTDKSELFDRGILNFSYDQFDQGIKDFQASLTNTDQDARALFSIGWSYEKQKKYKKALTYYNKAAALIGEEEVLLFVKAVAAKMKQ